MIFFAFLFFLIGIRGGFFSPFLLLFVLLPLSYLYFYQKKRKEILFLLPFLLLGFLVAFFYPKGKEGIEEITGFVVKSKENYLIVQTGKGKYYVYWKENNIPLFSYIHLKGISRERRSSHFEGSFRFDSYLKTIGVHYEFKKKSGEILWRSLLNRKSRKEYVCSSLNENSKILFCSLRFKDSLSSLKDYQSLSELNLSSSLSLSGFHLGFLLSTIEFFLGEKRRKTFNALSLFLPFLFLFLSGFSYAFVRIFLLSLFRTGTQISHFHLRYLSRLSLVGIIRLFFQPYSVSSPSFYYSFPFLFLLAIFPSKREAGFKPTLKFFVTRTLFYFPYRLYQFSSFSFLSPFFQLRLIPYSHLLFLFSCLLLLFPPLGLIYNYLCAGFLSLARFGSKRSLNLTSGVPLVPLVILYYLFFFLFLIYHHYGFPLEKKKRAIKISLVSLLFFVPDCLPHQEIIFLDVGQGDATLIRNGRANILFDTGGSIKNDRAKECLIPYFRKRKIRSLDAVVITHGDYDHSGALSSLLASFPVKAVYTRDSFLASTENTLEIAGRKIENLNTYFLSKEENDLSGVYRFTLGDKKVLIRGDATEKVEQKILEDKKDVRCDYLKVGHHGSDTSSSLSFLKAASPEEAFISVGYKNSYGLPDKEVLSRLSSLSIPFFRTDEQGSIKRELSFSLL